MGEREPERIMDALLLDFFDDYLEGEGALGMDGEELPEEVVLRRKGRGGQIDKK